MRFKITYLGEDEDDDANLNNVIDQYKSEGHRLMTTRHYQKAEWYFKKSLTIDKNSVTTLIHRSYCNLKLGYYEKALRDADLALKKQPKNVAALLQKGDTFYFMGKLEQALVFYHRAYRLAPRMRRCSLWVYICETAILHIVGDSKLLLNKDGDLSFLEKQIKRTQVNQSINTELRMKTKLVIPSKEPSGNSFDKIKDFSKDRKIIRIMGSLYEDRCSMEHIFHEADQKSRMGIQLRQCTYNMIQFIDKQTANMLNEAPPRIKEKRPAHLSSITDERTRINQAITRELGLIDVEQQEEKLSESLVRAENLLKAVLNYPPGVVRKLEEVVATLYGYIGNAHLEMKDLKNALTFFKKEKDLAIRHKLDNTCHHSMYSIGMVYVLMGEYKRAINMWSVRLSYAVLPEERCWLLHELGRCYYSLCDFHRALEFGDKGFNEAMKCHNTIWNINCLTLMAQARVGLFQNAQAIQDFYTALEFAELLDDAELIEYLKSSIKDLESMEESKSLEASPGVVLKEAALSSVAVQTQRPEGKLYTDENGQLQAEFHRDVEEPCPVEEVHKESYAESAVIFPHDQPDSFDHIQIEGNHKYAYITMATNDTYAIGALVLGETLKQSKTPFDRVVMVTSEVTGPIRDLLRETFTHVQSVQMIESKNIENLSLLKRAELGVTFSKIQAWRFTKYEKSIFLDADTIILHNIDELFEREPFAAAPDVGWPDCFNSGVFLFRPSHETYEELKSFALKVGSFDGGDQGLLNLFFSDWSTKNIESHLPFTYNMAWQAYYSYKPALKQFGDKVKVVHYIGTPKPWMHEWDPTNQKVVCLSIETVKNKELLQLWWDIFMSSVQNKLPKGGSGLIEKLSQLKVRGLASQKDYSPQEHERQQNWERNEIDYMGSDRFENIEMKLDEVIEDLGGPRGRRCVNLSVLKKLNRRPGSRRDNSGS